MSDEILVKANNVSKKFCRDLRRSILYGAKDIFHEISGFKIKHKVLRTNEFWAVKDISFELRRGECLGLIGQNGAGKSTLLKMLNGLILPDSGKITMIGRVGALIELGAGFNPILTGRENIYINGSVFGFSKKEIDKKLDKIIEFAEIGEFIDSPVQNYSSGMKVRLGFAVAAQNEPDVLIIDEVLAVGDIGFQTKCLNRMSELLQRSAVIFVSHSMPLVARTCTHAMLLNRGAVEYYGQDVEAGISGYHSKFAGGERTQAKDTKISLESVMLTNLGDGTNNKNGCLVLHHGQDMAVEISVKRLAPVSTIAFTICIWDQEIRPVADCHSMIDNFILHSDHTQSAVIATFRNILLTSGVYFLQILIYDEHEKEIFTNVQNAASFQVITALPGHASFRLSAEWRVATSALL